MFFCKKKETSVEGQNKLSKKKIGQEKNRVFFRRTHRVCRRTLRVGFWQNGFFSDFYGPPDFFADFLAGFFSPRFCGKKCPEKSSRKIPAKILQNFYNKNPPTHFCRMAGARTQ